MTEPNCSSCETSKWSSGPIPPNTGYRTNVPCLNIDRTITDMRLKAEVLQHKHNSNPWTKQQRYAHLSKRQIGTKKINIISEVQQEQFNAGIYTPTLDSSDCKDYKGIHMLHSGKDGTVLSSTSSSGIPYNPSLLLYYNEKHPLKNLNVQRQFTNVNNKGLPVNKLSCDTDVIPGPTGATGEQGDTGATGEKGDTGATGEKGDTGATGLQGIKGDAGAIGATGLQGIKGDAGAIGANGETGPTGAKGEAGPEVGAVPVGGIIMWSGANIPENWEVCDGKNNTPDLRDRFIIGSGTTFASGQKGGSLTISAENLPAHTHSGTVDAVGNHTHPAQCDANTSFSINTIKVEGSQQQETVYTPKSGGTQTSGIGTHTHGITVNEGGGHSHGFQGGVNTTENMNYYPPYYALAYIMRIS